MHKLRQFIIVALAIFLLASCATGGKERRSNWVADDAAIRAQLQDSMEAWNRGDLTGHLAIYDPQVTYITDKGPRPGVAAIEESFKKNYFSNGIPTQSLSFQDISVRPLSLDTALATGRYVLTGGGKPQQAGWFTLVWVRGSAGWRAVHDHSD